MSLGNNYQSHSPYEVWDYDPYQPLSVNRIHDEWENKRLGAWADLNQNYMTPFQSSLIPFLPYTAFLAILLLLLSAVWERWLFVIIFLLGVSFIALKAGWKLWRVGSKLRNQVDATVYISVQNWIKTRYGLEIEYEDTLSSILRGVNSDVDGVYTGLHLGFPSEEFRLDLLSAGSNPQLIVSNIHGEAPILVNR